MTPVRLEILEDLEKPKPPERPDRAAVPELLPFHIVASEA